MKAFRIISLVWLASLVPDTDTFTSRSSQKLEQLCGAGYLFEKGYRKACKSNPVPTTTAIALCEATKARFLSADDITEAEQMRNTRMLKSVAVDLSDLCDSKEQRLKNVVERIYKATKYLGSLKNMKYNSAVTGLRAVQGQIALMLSTVKNEALLAELIALEKRCKDVALRLEDENSFNWNNADQATSATFFWKSPKSWKSSEILASHPLQTLSYFHNLTKYSKHHDLNNDCEIRMMRDCDISQQCADLLIQPDAQITTLAHIAEFFRMAIKMECVEEVEFANKFPDGNWEQVVDANCARMWNEANVIADAGYPTGFKGLFLTHGTMCGMLGYPNFLRVDWITSVMTWMDSTQSGCIAPDSTTGAGNADLGYDSLAENGEWCTIYETSMGIQLMAMHMRYAFEICPS